jgi:RHS repeat-associated protein
MSVPIGMSPGRAGFGPQLSLSYDSGSGNGPFGFGWRLSTTQITRKTDKGLCRYQDAAESDEYIYSGFEDLVPLLQPDGTRFVDTGSHPGFAIHRYLPRVENVFSRIERWVNRATGETHWRSISMENLTSIYGRTHESRIADPHDPLRVFTWLLCESYDATGNAIVYRYVAEDAANIDPASVNERNRVCKANRYLKRVLYGNRIPRVAGEDLTLRVDWLFEVVLDYSEGHVADLPLNPLIPGDDQHRLVQASNQPSSTWALRLDPFSQYRSGFEVRTYRRCHRVLMFHRFDELGAEPYLVRETSFDYEDLDYSLPNTNIDTEFGHSGSTRFASFLRSAAQHGFERTADPVKVRDGVTFVTYLKKSVPPVEFEYSRPAIRDDIQRIDAESLENLPVGTEGGGYQWVDLDGEGVSGILSQQAKAWIYKSNLGGGRFGPAATLSLQPSLSGLNEGKQQLLDLGGDGNLDLVSFSGPMPGFYERGEQGGWLAFKPFRTLPQLSWDDPNLRFVDLDGDGHADVLITEHQVFTWYPSLAQEGFGPSARVLMSLDEEKGPRLVLADGEQSIYLADMSGDGLTDLVRIRNGEVSYWPNLGYGHFGAKVAMDNVSEFDHVDQFSHSRIRLADIDGSGTTDIIYLGRDDARIYFNQSGNRLSGPRPLPQFPRLQTVSDVSTADLLGNGTACLVWCSPLPADARSPIRYIDLMGGIKPHLLIKAANNLGAETRIRYVSSTQFYLADKAAGRPWITKLPFPVHVVERIETYDWISRNLFVQRNAYHHGYFDGDDREFRGFGLVEQWDTEEFGVLTADGAMPDASNIDAASSIPPVLTKTWFHTGVHVGRNHVSDFFAGLLRPSDTGEYYREPGLSGVQARALLLDDTVLPDGLTVADEREACRALKGSVLRREVYSLDGTARERHPYTVTEQNFTILPIQNRGINRHAVFFTHARESLSFQYERDPSDPRVAHALTLETDRFGNVRRQASVAYPRRHPDPDLTPADQAKQSQLLITYTENDVTNLLDQPDDYRTPAIHETRTYELTGLQLAAGASRFRFSEILAAGTGAAPLDFEQTPSGAIQQKRLIEHRRTYYRRNDLTGALPLGQIESMALPFDTYRLALTPGLVTNVYASKVTNAMLADEGRYVHTEGDLNWWMPSGRTFFSPDPAHTPAQELAFAHAHFFLPHRFRDPFHTPLLSTENFVTYDSYHLLVLDTQDAAGNRITAGERNAAGVIVSRSINYRALQPELVMDPNRNRSAVVFDSLNMVVGTAVMGKPLPAAAQGDLITPAFEPNLTDAVVQDQLANPTANPQAILHRASTRLVYDLFAYQRTKALPKPSAPVVYTVARETHDSDQVPATGLRFHYSFAYSDGFGREIQHKVRAEDGPIPVRDLNGDVILGAGGQPVMTAGAVAPRWIGTGWAVFNNKAKPVRQYEPFFTGTHRFEFDVRVGVSPVLMYDPVTRVIATLHANRTWEKVVFNAWRSDSWDVNDTVSIPDPSADPDVGQWFARLPAADYLPTWYGQRIGGAMGPDEQTTAQQTSIHAATPARAYVDPLGRTFATIVHNKFKYTHQPPAAPPVEEFYRTRVNLDIKGSRLDVIDALGRSVMRYEVEMTGVRIHSLSMDAGQRWMLNDCSANPLYAWDSLNRRVETSYDTSRRAIATIVQIGAGLPQTVSRTVYGETLPNPEDSNLRTKPVAVMEQSGVLTTDEYDFKGNALRSQREFAQVYNATLDWSGAVPLSGAPFVSRTAFDALNRAVELTTPDNSIIRHAYNEANLLNQVDVRLQGAWTPFITNIDYNAKGQRLLVEYGNSAKTSYDYDPLTFRATRIQTTRNPVRFPGDCPRTPVPGWPGCAVQDLRYTYDPIGNVTHLVDNAQQILFFQNRRVEPRASYLYDATYRLIEAVGREHLGQISNPPTPHSYNDRPRIGIPLSANDGMAVGRYLERYTYDPAGNLSAMQHAGTNPANPGWTRQYDYLEHSLIEPAQTGNRLTRSTVAGAVENYSVAGNGYNAHGAMLRMPHLQEMRWDLRDQLQMTRRQAVGGGDADGAAHAGEQTWFVYDSDGKRVRKVTEIGGVVIEERFYAGLFELYRRGGVGALTRESLHVVDGDHRFALVETRTDVFEQLIRFQFGNHLDSSMLELDADANIVSYEEYTPFGSTSLQAVEAQLPFAKRYRFIAKERDDETGFSYHGARYYAPWLARWTSCDPSELVDGFNVYTYSRNNPVILRDTNGRWSWGKTLGLIAAVAVGVAVTAATGGIAGPVVAGIIGGAFAGAVGEVVEASVDGRPITAGNVITAAVIGGVTGGVFSGAGQLIARTQVGQRLAARVVGSQAGQAVARLAYRAATSQSPAAVAARAVSRAVQRRVEVLQEAGEAVGQRLGGPFARNAAAQAERRAGIAAAEADAAGRAGSGGVQATLQGEMNGNPVSATTRSGVDRSGTGIRAIETPAGRVPSPDPLPAPLEPVAVPGANGQAFVRGADAEIKLFGHALMTTPAGSTGRLYLGVTAPICPSCRLNLWNTRSALPGLQIISDMPSVLPGGAGGGAGVLPNPTPPLPPPSSNLPEPIPILRLEGRF